MIKPIPIETMKTRAFTLIVVLLSATRLALGADPLSDALQKGLFEEEANHNLDAAIKAYQMVISATDEQRKLSATAIFRLGECYRKLGRTNEAAAQYQRILREFPDQEALIKLSRANVLSPGAAPSGAESAANLELLNYLKGLNQSELRKVLPSVVDDPLLNSLHKQLAETEQKLAGLTGVYAEEHPEVKRVRAVLKTIDAQVAERQEGILKGLEARAGLVSASSSKPGADATLTDEEENELKQIKAIIRDSPDLINAKAKNEWSRLQNAAAAGQVRVAEFLLANGADVNANFRAAGTPLHLAAQNGHKTMTELLLKHGAEINNRDPGGTPLHYAVENGHRAVAETLLANKADVNAKGNGRTVTGEFTPLHLAAFKGFVTVAELLLAKGAQVNSLDKGGQTPLHYAATYGSLRVAQLLLTNKAEVNARTEDGWTPLHFAVKYNRLPIARLLVEKQAEVNARITGGEFKGWSPLHLAAEFCDRAMTELLLTNKAEVDAMTPSSQTPLILAAGQKKSEVVEALLAAGANVNAQLENHHTALSLAVKANDERTASVILARKPDLEMRGENNLTVLQSAVANRQDSLAELLLRTGANPNVFDDQYGNTPLHWAVDPKRKPLVKLLLAHQANVNARNNSGLTPLDLTKPSQGFPPRINPDQAGLDEIAALLKEAGADEQMQRRSAISISRRSRDYLAPWFVQGSNTWNHFTLLELIASIYSQSPPLAFPDFTRVTISRLGSAGAKSTELAVDVDALIRSGDCSKDIPLAWGDVVDIPERDRKLNEIWQGLPAEVYPMLKNCLERKVEVIVKGETILLTLKQNFGSASGGSTSSSPQWSMFWLGSALRNGNVLRASSDLRHVKVRRVDPFAKQPLEMVFDAERRDSRTDLWLRDGDVIEVPEK